MNQPEIKSEVIKTMGREELLRLLDAHAKNWLALDGCWFLAIEGEFGWDTAMKIDAVAWQQYTVSEARRIKRYFGITGENGLKDLEVALQLRPYSLVNDYRLYYEQDTLILEMLKCRVQDTRDLKGLPLHKCKPVGLIEYGGFAKTINPDIETQCVHCPPDPGRKACKWRFVLKNHLIR